MNDNSDKREKSRLPPGQHITDRFPILQKGSIPHINRENYILDVNGEVEYHAKFTLPELKEMHDKDIITDIHCVTSWSKFDTKWGGISFKKFFEIIKPKKTVKFVEFLCADDNFTTTVPIEILKADNTLLALSYEEKPINDEHGGPVRLIIPDLYFYKSAKWVTKITFLDKDRLGYWERAGYSNKADPWKEQRYSYND